MDVYCQHAGITHSHSQWNAYNERDTDTQQHLTYHRDLQAGGKQEGFLTRSNVSLALAHQPCTERWCCIARCSLTTGFFFFSLKVGLSPLMLRRQNFSAALGIFELLHLLSPSAPSAEKDLYCFFPSALHTLDEAPIRLHKAGYNSPLPIKAFTRVRQLVCKACCLPCWLMLSDCSLVLPRWSICTHLLPFVF